MMTERPVKNPELPTPPPMVSPEIEADIDLAAVCSLPVLITAPATRAASIVHAIATRVPGAIQPKIVVCKPMPEEAWVEAIARHVAERAAHVIWISNIDRLDAPRQADLLSLLDDRARAGGRIPRIVASSAVDLYDRVDKGAFDADLFYRLNTIHIVDLD